MTSKNNTPTKTPKKLKIAVLLRRFITTGGAERYAVEVTRQLSVKHDIHVFAQEWTPEGNENITFHKVPKFFTKPSFLNMLVFSFFTKKYLDESFDIIHSHERVTRFDVLTIHCPCFKTFLTQEKRLWKKIMLWLSITLSPRKIAYLWMEKKQFTYSSNRLLIAVSKKVKQNVQENYSLPDNYFDLAYPGVNINFGSINNNRDVRNAMRLELGIGENDTVILFVGTEFKRKGLDSLIKGFSILSHSSVKLIIAGGGEQKHYISLSEDLGIEKDVVFLGLVKDIAPIYALSDIFILPTLSDPAAMSPLEAMASGIATIMSSSKYNGCAEHITKGEALILEHPDNPHEIAEALESLMDVHCRQLMAIKGQELTNRLSWDKTTEQTLSAYYKILDKKAPLN